MRFTRGKFPVLVIIGPSGAGKSTVIRRLFEAGIVHVNPSWTTRPPRGDEANQDVEHRFVSEKEFAAREKSGYFLEAAQMFGLPYRYGLPELEHPKPGAVALVMLRAYLIPLFQKYYPDYKIYQIEDELARIKQRLADRESRGEKLGTRLEDYQKEIAQGRQIADKVFVNRGIEPLERQLKKAVKEDFGL